MAVNPAGMQQVFDFGIPQTIPCKAAGVVSGGDFVYVGSQSAPVSSGANSFSFGDIFVLSPASGTNRAVGICTQNQTSGLAVGVLVRGGVLITAAGAISAGEKVVWEAGGTHTVVTGSNAALSSIEYERYVGQALTTAGSTEYVLVNVNI